MASAWSPEIGVKLPPTFLNLVMIVNTVILLASSVTYHWGEVRMRKGGSGLIGYGLTALFGTIFLGGAGMGVDASQA